MTKTIGTPPRAARGRARTSLQYAPPVSVGWHDSRLRRSGPATDDDPASATGGEPQPCVQVEPFRIDHDNLDYAVTILGRRDKRGEEIRWRDI